MRRSAKMGAVEKDANPVLKNREQSERRPEEDANPISPQPHHTLSPTDHQSWEALELPQVSETLISKTGFPSEKISPNAKRQTGAPPEKISPQKT